MTKPAEQEEVMTKEISAKRRLLIVLVGILSMPAAYISMARIAEPLQQDPPSRAYSIAQAFLSDIPKHCIAAEADSGRAPTHADIKTPSSLATDPPAKIRIVNDFQSGVLMPGKSCYSAAAIVASTSPPDIGFSITYNSLNDKSVRSCGFINDGTLAKGNESDLEAIGCKNGTW